MMLETEQLNAGKKKSCFYFGLILLQSLNKKVWIYLSWRNF